METQKKLINQTTWTNPFTEVPLVQFADIDRDGMIDMTFYYKKHLYVYYNLHQNKKPSGFDSLYLCLKWT